MGLEIERKYAVDRDKLILDGYHSVYIEQAYPTGDQIEPCVRVRTVNDEYNIAAIAFITIKGKNDGITRREYEYEIPFDEAQKIIQMCPKVLSKTRYIIDRWEVDVFHGRNQGLVLADIELEDENEEIVLPAWISHEVSDDPRFYNSNLINN